MIKKFLFFFNKHQKKSLLFLLILMFISTILEMIGLGFIFSIVGTLLVSTNSKSDLFISKLDQIIELDRTEIISYLLVIFLLFYVAKIIFLIFYNWYESKFIYSYQKNLSGRVFKEYLNQNLSYFFNRNSSEFIRNLITEVDQFLFFLGSILKLILEVVVVIGIVLLLGVIDLYFAIMISLVF